MNVSRSRFAVNAEADGHWFAASLPAAPQSERLYYWRPLVSRAGARSFALGHAISATDS